MSSNVALHDSNIKNRCHSERNEVESLSRRNGMKTGRIYFFKASDNPEKRVLP